MDVAVCCSVLQCVAVCQKSFGVWRFLNVDVAVCCSVLQCVAICQKSFGVEVFECGCQKISAYQKYADILVTACQKSFVVRMILYVDVKRYSHTRSTQMFW